MGGWKPCLCLIIGLTIFLQTDTSSASDLCPPLAELDICKIFDKQYKMHVSGGILVNSNTDPWPQERCIEWCINASMATPGDCQAVEWDNTDAPNTQYTFPGACWKFGFAGPNLYWKYGPAPYTFGALDYTERYVYLTDHQFSTSSPSSNHCPPEVLVDEINGCIIQSYKGYKGADGYHYANITEVDYIDCRDICFATPTRCYTFSHSEEAEECLLYEESKSFVLQRDNRALYTPDGTDFKKPEFNYYRFECMTDHLPGKTSARDKAQFLLEQCGYTKQKNMSCAGHASLEVVATATTQIACHVACIDSPRCVAYSFNTLTSDCRHCGYDWDPLENVTDYTVYTPICNCDEEPEPPSCLPWDPPAPESCTTWTIHPRSTFQSSSDQLIIGQWGSRPNDCLDACLEGRGQDYVGKDCNVLVFDFSALNDPFSAISPMNPYDWAYGDYRCMLSEVFNVRATTYNRFAFVKTAGTCPANDSPVNETATIDDVDYTFCLTRYPDHSQFMGTGFGKAVDSYGTAISTEEDCKNACLESHPPNICHGFSWYPGRHLDMDITTEPCVFLEDKENPYSMHQVAGASLSIIKRQPCT